MLLAIMVSLSGCGNSRTKVPDLLTPEAPVGFRTLDYTRAGIELAVPRNWPVLGERSPGIAVASSGQAVIALWRFPRTAAPPVGSPALQAASNALLAAAQRRDPGMKLIRSGVLTVDGSPAVELDAFEQVGGQLRRVRSLHVYLAGAEVVLEEYAPPAAFHAVDHLVFSPVRRSLRLLTARPS